MCQKDSAPGALEVTLAVVSDLHCHHSSQGPTESLLLTDGDRIPTAQHPVESLLELIAREQLTADALLMPGDLTNKVDRQGMHSGWSFVREIAEALGVKTIAATLGNHDVLSRKPSADPFGPAKVLSPPFPIGGPPNEAFWSSGFCILNEPTYRILVINSVASHTNDEAAKQGLVSNHQLDAISRVLGSAPTESVQVALCHHHPILHEDVNLGKSDVMENGSLLTALLAEKGFDLIVHGHKHHPKISYAPGATPLPVLAAGSFSACMKTGLATRTRNLFHLLKLGKQASGVPAQGRVLTWQFRQWKGWTPASWDAADFPHRTGFGCHETPKSLAATVEVAFRRTGVPVLKWAEITCQCPNLLFIPPTTLEALGICLRSQGLHLQPFPPDEPVYIGVEQ